MSEVMTWGDLFAGGGGATCGALGVKNTQVLWALNHSASAIATHAANHPETVHYQADIRFQDEHDLAEVDGIWMSSECTNFTKAKGGKTRDLGSYSLPWELLRFAKQCNPSVIIVENVKEFLNWGEWKDEHKVIHDRGVTYNKWVRKLRRMGYSNYQYQLLNAADFGAYTSRIRYFGIFTKKGHKIQFPKPTHHKTGANGLLTWMPCKDKINLNDIGKSIWEMDLCPNTITRIEAGLKKFGGDPFILKYYGSKGCDNSSSLNEPLGTLMTKSHHVVIQFLVKYGYHNPKHPELNAESLDQPISTLITTERQVLITQFLMSYYSSPRPQHMCHSLNSPVPTLMTTDRHAIITQNGYDIYYRFISVQEAKELQGFPAEYILEGSKTQQLKQIGNAVVPLIAKLLIEHNYLEVKVA